MALSPQAAVSALETTGDPSVILVSHHHSCILHSSPISLLLRCRPLKLPSSSPLPPPASFYLHSPLKLPLLFHFPFILSFSTLCPLSPPKLPLFSRPSPSSSPASLTFSCPQIFLPALVSSSPPPPPPSLPCFCFCFLPLSFLLLSSPIFPLHGTVAL